jgi:uncharacterized membrane protein
MHNGGIGDLGFSSQYKGFGPGFYVTILLIVGIVNTIFGLSPLESNKLLNTSFLLIFLIIGLFLFSEILPISWVIEDLFGKLFDGGIILCVALNIIGFMVAVTKKINIVTKN